MNQKLTLETLCGGAVQEKVDRALHAIAENILDPNTDPKKKRTITIKVICAPNGDDREDVTVTVDVTKTLAPDTGVNTHFFLGKDLETGAVTVKEHVKGEIKGQLNFSDVEEEFDEETGEIYTPNVIGFKMG